MKIINVTCGKCKVTYKYVKGRLICRKCGRVIVA